MRTSEKAMSEHAVAARRPGKSQTLRSDFMAGNHAVRPFGASAKSASLLSERICGGVVRRYLLPHPRSSIFLKPRTAAPRSDTIVRSFLAPNTKSTTIRITTSSRIPIPISFNSR